jgi:hypothetical protein
MGTLRDPQADSKNDGEEINIRTVNRIVIEVFIVSANWKVFSSIAVQA